MTQKEFNSLKADWWDYVRYEGEIHGGTGTAITNCYSYQQGHDDFQEWLIDGFSDLLKEAEKNITQ